MLGNMLTLYRPCTAALSSLMSENQDTRRAWKGVTGRLIISVPRSPQEPA
jgi:hypothetical protein